MLRDILARLVESLQLALHTLDAGTGHQYHVVDIPSDGPPRDFVFNTVEEVGAHIHAVRLETQLAQMRDPNFTFFLRIYAGKRWLIRKGVRWKLDTGSELIDISGGIVVVPSDDDGSISELPADMPLAPAVAPAPQRAATPAEIMPGYVETRPARLLGDEEQSDDDEPIIES